MSDSSAAPVWPGWRWLSGAFLAYVGMAVLHTYPLVFHLGERTPGFSNSAMTAYVMAEQALLFYVEHPFDIIAAFSPTVFQPLEHAFLYCNTSIVSSILFGPIYVLTGNVYLLHNIFVLFCLPASALSVFILARYWTRSDRAGFVAGTIASFGSANLYFFADTIFFNSFFIPFVVLFFDRFILEGKRRYLIFTAILLAVQFYNNSYHVVLAALFIVALTVYRWRRVFTRANLPWIVSSAALSLLLMAPLAIQYLRITAGIDLQLNALQSGLSIAPAEWFNVHPDNLLYGEWLAQEYESRSMEFLGALFPGFLVVGLSVLGLARKSTARVSPYVHLVLFLFMVSLTTGLSPLGFFKRPHVEPVVLASLAEVFPPLALFRVPYRVLTLASLAGALIAAGGYLYFEQRYFARRSRVQTLVLVGLVVAVVNLENLVLPRELNDYENIYSPSSGDEWLKQRGIPERSEDLILHIPSWLYRRETRMDVAFEVLYPEMFAPLYRHLHNRHPMANDRLSYVPNGWAPQESKRLPERISQQYLRAIGVKIVVVHHQMLYGQLRRAFAEEGVVGAGMKRLAAFGDGDVVYEIDLEVEKTPALTLMPAIVEGELQIGFAARDPAAICGIGKRLNTSRCPARDHDLSAEEKRACCESAELFWVNPKHCARQQMEITVRDGNGELHGKTLDYSLPLVIKDELITPPLKWDFVSDGLVGPVRLKSVAFEEDYIHGPARKSLAWQLEVIH